MDNNILGRRIREARGDLSLRDFARLCGISHTHLDSLEKGTDPRTGKEVSVGWETLKKLSTATGFSISYLVGDSNNKLADHTDNPSPLIVRNDLPTIEETAEALQIMLYNTLGREPTRDELRKFREFAELFIKGLDKDSNP